MRIFSFLCLLIALGMGTPTASAQSKPQALLSKLKQELYNGTSQLSFSSQYTRSGKTTPAPDGEVTLQGDAFRMQIGDQITATYQGGTLAYYDKGEHTLTFTTPTAEELIQINPLYFLTGAERTYRIERQKSPAGTDVLLFTPLLKGNIQSVELRLRGVRPESIQVEDKSKQRFEAKIKQIRTVSKLGADQFVLKASQFPGCEVVDLR